MASRPDVYPVQQLLSWVAHRVRAILVRVAAGGNPRLRIQGGQELPETYAVDARPPWFVAAGSDVGRDVMHLSSEDSGRPYLPSLRQAARKDAGLGPHGERLPFVVRERTCGAGALLRP